MRSVASKSLEMEISNEEESTSSEDDENAELLTEELEEGFYKVISRLKSKDPKLYNGNEVFFSDKVPIKESPSASQNCDETIKQSEEKGPRDNHVEDFRSNASLSKDEQFLRDYMVNKKYLESDKKFDVNKELENFSEEEKEIEEELTFEEKYNSRFENEDKEFLKKFPRTMEKSVGKKTEISDFKADNSNSGKVRSLEELCNSSEESEITPKKKRKIENQNGESIEANSQDSVAACQSTCVEKSSQATGKKKRRRRRINQKNRNRNKK